MAEKHSTLTQERLKELLHYDPDTGVFTWLVRRGAANAGSVAGAYRDGGRITIYVDNIPYSAPNLAWLYVHGSFPPKNLKTINGITGDNRIANFYDPRIPMPKVIHAPLTADRVRELLDYDPESGVFTRKLVVGKTGDVGDVIGFVNKHNRVEISVDGKIYRAHRVAWLHFYGEWPKHSIDHIDCNPENNAISNLRDIPQALNAQNIRQARPNSLTGILGVRKRHNRWRVELGVNGKNLFIGTFGSPEEAQQAYIAAKRIHHAACTL